MTIWRFGLTRAWPPLLPSSLSLSGQERVGNFLAAFYFVNGLVLESRKRREHLSEEDILRNKAIMESLSKGGNISEQSFEVSANTHTHVLTLSHRSDTRTHRTDTHAHRTDTHAHTTDTHTNTHTLRRHGHNRQRRNRHRHQTHRQAHRHNGHTHRRKDRQTQG